MENITLSAFQNAIIENVVNSTENLIVNALAGSGKTFTMVLAANEYLKAHPTHNVVMSAFNKSIADELERKISDSRVLCKTSHSIGLMAIRNYLKLNNGSRLPLIINDKYWHYELCYNLDKYSDIITDEVKNDVKFTFISNVDQLLNLCRLNLVRADETEKINAIIDTFAINTIADEVSAVKKILMNVYELRIVSNVKEPKGRTIKVHPRAFVIDYTDMLTFAATHSKWCNKFNLFIGDECQDFNKAQHQLIANSLTTNGKWVCVGDPHQAINGFAGAMNDSFAQLAENANELPLSVNYRCGRNIIELAQTIVPSIVAHDGAIDGQVTHVTDFKEVKDGDFILCRTKAPLVKVAMKFLANGRSANILGRDLATNLKGLIKQAVGTAKSTMGLSSSVLMDKLNELKDKQMADIVNKGYNADRIEAHPTIIELSDKIECIDNISLTCLNISEVFEKIDYLFSEEQKKNAVTLMTAHKSKGLENDNVFIILPQKLPLTWDDQQEWQYEQEKNLEYVAYTRAKKNLYIVDGSYEDIARMDIE